MNKDSMNMTYHHLLYFVKWFLIVFTAIDLFSMFFHEFTYARVIEQCFACVKLGLLTASVMLHERKPGVYLLCAYFAIELAWFYMIVVLTGVNASMFTDQVLNYSLGTAFILVPTVLYYRKRWNVLN